MSMLNSASNMLSMACTFCGDKKVKNMLFLEETSGGLEDGTTCLLPMACPHLDVVRFICLGFGLPFWEVFPKYERIPTLRLCFKCSELFEKARIFQDQYVGLLNDIGSRIGWGGGGDTTGFPTCYRRLKEGVLEVVKKVIAKQKGSSTGISATATATTGTGTKTIGFDALIPGVQFNSGLGTASGSTAMENLQPTPPHPKLSNPNIWRNQGLAQNLPSILISKVTPIPTVAKPQQAVGVKQDGLIRLLATPVKSHSYDQKKLGLGQRFIIAPTPTCTRTPVSSPSTSSSFVPLPLKKPNSELTSTALMSNREKADAISLLKIKVKEEANERKNNDDNKAPHAKRQKIDLFTTRIDKNELNSQVVNEDDCRQTCQEEEDEMSLVIKEIRSLSSTENFTAAAAEMKPLAVNSMTLSETVQNSTNCSILNDLNDKKTAIKAKIPKGQVPLDNTPTETIKKKLVKVPENEKRNGVHTPKSPVGTNDGAREKEMEEMMLSNSEAMYCELCSERCRCFASLVAHIKHEHDTFTLSRGSSTRGNAAKIVSYRCGRPLCGKTFKTEAILTWHEANHKRIEENDNVPSYKCPICVLVLHTEDRILSHCMEHASDLYPKHQKKSSKCRLCEKLFKWPANLRTHEIDAHLPQLTSKCNDCSAKYSSSNILKAHRIIHEKDAAPFGCSICRTEWSTKDEFESHLIASHVPQNAYVEKAQGNDSFSSSNEVGSPEGNVKVKIEPIECEYCSATYKSDQGYIMHLINIHEKAEGKDKNYSCTTCGKKFIGAALLARHVTVRHGDTEEIGSSTQDSKIQKKGKIFVCDVCESSPRNGEAGLFRHMKQEHPEEYEAMKEEKKANSKAEKFKCPIEGCTCTTEYSNFNLLTNHYWKHHNELLVYACDFQGCNRRYPSEEYLALHKPAHPIYPCDLCGLKFPTITKLSKHVSIHNAELDAHLNGK